jgi:hypothetical protein
MKIEVSNGEIVDKLTILEIKKEKCKDTDKSANIEKELNYLQDIVSTLNISQDIINSLREVNKKLWEIEDELRVFENRFVFDDDFISLARMVYHTNDKRFGIKSEINQITNSNFKEEKILPKYMNSFGNG